jgi:chitin disaccharide deacetylase
MIVCADDYGWSDDVNRAIVELVAARRVSAVSCMAVLPQCAPENLKPLLEHADHIDLGLHFTVTARFLDGDRFERSAPAHAVNFFSALTSCVLRRITPAQAKEEIAAQYQLFAERTGRLPDFLDGHLHVQQLPVLGDVTIQFVENLPGGDRPYVRNSYMPLAKIRAQGVSFWKSASISTSGKQFRRRLAASGLATNDGFAGVYHYRHWRRYRDFLHRFTTHMESPTGILVVHPGFAESWRRAEFEALRQATFLTDVVQRFRK